MKRQSLRFILLAGVMLLASQVSGQAVECFWHVEPYVEIARSDSVLSLAPNNGWAICRQMAGVHNRRLHIVYCADTNMPRAYYLNSDTRGRIWGNYYKFPVHNEDKDTVRDVVIACYADTIAVAYYDDWFSGSNPLHHICYMQNLNGGDTLTWERFTRLSDPDETHYANKHPSIVITYKPRDIEEEHEGSVARAVWADSTYNPTEGWGFWPFTNSVRAHPFDMGFDQSVCDDSCADYPSICWDWDMDQKNDAYIAFQQIRPDSSWDIFFVRSVYMAPERVWKIAGSVYPDEHPSIQWTGRGSGYEQFAVAYQRTVNNKTRIRVALVKWFNSDHIETQDIEPFSNYRPDDQLCEPQLWRRGEDAQNDTLFMVFILVRATDPQKKYAYFSYSTDKGENWAKPIKLTFGYPYVQAVSLTSDGAGISTVMQRYHPAWDYYQIVYRGARYVQYIAVDAIPPNTARVLQQLQSPSNCLYRAYPVEDFIAVDRSTDNGLTWEDIFSPGWGKNPAIATDGDSAVAAFFVEGCSLYCAWWYPSVMDWTLPQVVFAGVEGEVPLNPSVALYPGDVAGMKVAGVAFAVYDTVEGTSRIMFAKVDTGTVILDTIDSQDKLTDSFPCINIVNTDTVYVTYQRGTEVLSSALYDYPAGSTERPPAWTMLPIITADGFHPMSALEEGVLHCVYARRIQPEEESDTLVICHSTLDVTDSPQFSSWQDGADPSSRTTLDKDTPVYAGVGVTVWQEMLNNKWAIRGCVRAETLTFVSKANHCRYPQAIAESSAVSPSIDQVRVKLLWTEEVCEDMAVLGFKVESLNVSRASANATRFNNGRKLIRRQGSDSLFAVYVDLDGAVMFARSANGDSWKRTVITEECENPAIAEDGTGRRWVVMNYTGNAYTERIQARYLNANGTWSNGQTIYSASGEGSFGPVAIATASDEENPCCYAAFLYHNGSGNRFLIVAKFDGDSVRTDTVATGDNLSDPAIAVEPSPQGDYLHLVWTDDGEVKYTMSESRIMANNWDFGFPSDWKGAVNLSNSQTPSVHPVIAADQSRIVVSWAEGVIPEVLARYRSTEDEYNIWLGPFNLSNTQDYISDYPTIALSDTCVIAWQEQGQNEDYDIMASVEFAEAFNINDNQTPSTYPHILFQKKTSGDSTIPYLHCIYSEAPSQNYYEVGYHKLNLNQTGGGGQQGGEFVYLEPRLYQCAPNPFSRRTSIRFQIGHQGNVNLRVYDIQGRLVRTLISGEQKPGSYTVVWDGKDGHNRQVPNGVYFYRLDAPGITDTKKTVLMR